MFEKQILFKQELLEAECYQGKKDCECPAGRWQEVFIERVDAVKMSVPRNEVK